MKEFLLQTMPKRETFSSNTAYPPFSKKNPLLVDRYKAEKKPAESVEENEHKNENQSAAANGKNTDESGAMGILTDFMFRVLLATKTGTEMNYRIAYKAIERQRAKAEFFDKIGKDSTYYRDSVNVMLKFFDKYKDAIDALIRKRGANKSSDAANGMFFMARMEQVARGDPLGMKFFLDCNERIVNESVQIRDLFKKVFFDSGLVRNDSDVVLSPTFGKWSARIGGADADVFIDGTLYDFKSRINSCGYRQGDIMQLWGYYLLNRLRVDGVESCWMRNGDTDDEDALDTLEKREINHLAIYFSRYGVIYSCPVPEVGEEELKEFAWIIDRMPII